MTSPDGDSPTQSGAGRPLLRLTDVSKHYGNVPALHHFSLDVFSGDFIALFGPNGAGKTTLLKVLASLIKPDSGKLEFSTKQAVRGTVGYVSHHSLLYNELTGLENLVFYGRLNQVAQAEKRAEEMLHKMGLKSAAGARVRGYSRGMKQRLTLGRALLHDPPLLLLDEPYTGLDQHGGRLLTETLRGLKELKRTVFLVTHNAHQGLQLCSRVLIQNQGRLIFESSRQKVSDQEFEGIYFRVVGDGCE
ncbi:MAG: ABC transporter ATP-binding protein [Acidobacteriota bacterium]